MVVVVVVEALSAVLIVVGADLIAGIDSGGCNGAGLLTDGLTG